MSVVIVASTPKGLIITFVKGRGGGGGGEEITAGKAGGQHTTFLEGKPLAFLMGRYSSPRPCGGRVPVETCAPQCQSEGIDRPLAL